MKQLDNTIEKVAKHLYEHYSDTHQSNFIYEHAGLVLQNFHRQFAKELIDIILEDMKDD